MNRRIALAALALVTSGAFAGQALAAPASPQLNPTNPGICIGGTNDPQGPMEGICVWVPTR